MSGIDVLIVEDAPEYQHLVTSVLREAGHRTRVAPTIADALESLSAVPPDLVVLDLSLPDGDGLDLCRTIRERSNAYVLMLTSRDDEVDQLVGFRLGADDYVTKPFSPRLLAARVDAIARRPRPDAEEPSDREVGNLVIRTLAREVDIAGQGLELTRIEFDLLDQLTANPTQVLTRAQLMERVWGEDWYGSDHVVDVHIANLRKKVRAAGGRDPVRTVRGVGYGLAT